MSRVGKKPIVIPKGVTITASPAELEAVVEQVRAHQNAERTKTTIVLSRIVERTPAT